MHSRKNQFESYEFQPVLNKIPFYFFLFFFPCSFYLLKRRTFLKSKLIANYQWANIGCKVRAVGTKLSLLIYFEYNRLFVNSGLQCAFNSAVLLCLILKYFARKDNHKNYFKKKLFRYFVVLKL